MLFSSYLMKRMGLACFTSFSFVLWYFLCVGHTLNYWTAPPWQPCDQCAYATYLSTSDKNSTINSQYFDAVRVLNYQILLHPPTRTRLAIPFIVVVAPNVSAKMRKALEEEGAIVIAVHDVRPETDWLKETQQRKHSIDQLTKLRIFDLVDYKRILYIDPDTLLTRPIDGIFDDPSVKEDFRTLAVFESDSPNRDEIDAQPPPTYLVAGTSLSGSQDFFSSTFFLIQPSSYLFIYYTLILSKINAFNSAFMDQGLLNHVHRKNGSMPWMEFEGGLWNVRKPTWEDKRKGFACLQDRFWEDDAEKWADRKLVMLWRAMKGEMERYWDGIRERQQWE